MWAHLALAADHSWRLDLSSLAAMLAAAGGILAAVGTGLLAFFTWRLAKETHDLARETAEDVRAELRPVLIAQAPEALECHVNQHETLCTASVTVTNVGPGPAINTQFSITSASSVEQLTTGPDGAGTIAPSGSIGLGYPGHLFRDSSGNSESWLRWTLTVSYEDLAERVYTTTLVYDDPRNGHRSPDPAGHTNFRVGSPHTRVFTGRPEPPEPRPTAEVPKQVPRPDSYAS